MRFRYTTPSGDAVEVRDLDSLREHVASGRIRDDTPLHDRMTGEHGDARTHKAYRFVVDMFGVPLPGEPDGADDAPCGDSLPDLGITLADAHEPESTDEFVARLEKERASEDDGVPRTVRDLAAVLADSHDQLGPLDEHPVPVPRVGTSRSGEGSGAETETEVDAPAPGAAATDATAEIPLGPPPPSSRRARAATRRREIQRGVRESDGRRWLVPGRGRAAGALLALAGAGFLALQSEGVPPVLDASPGPMEPEAPVEVGPPPLDPRGIADRLAASEGIAFQHMVEGMDSLARVHRVFQVPEVWLEGAYLADAAAHPQVEAYWERYLAFVEELRLQDGTLFRRSFMGRMEGLGVAPSVRSLRLAQAVRRFAGTQPLRDTMYTRMEDLARAALTLHDLMVVRADRIRHTPVTRVSAVRDPFLQIYTEDQALQEEIYTLLDRVFENLEALHGETRWTRDELNDGVLESLRSTGGAG